MTRRRDGWTAVRRTVSPSIRPARLLLALKSAIAVGLAWPIAQLLPGAIDDYSYYAPLGALISMMPTLMGSLRASLQTVAGLALGIGLAWAVLESPLPGIAAVPLAVGIGVVVGGIRGLGAGRDYVAIAALFVLVIGGAHADDYSLGYLVQMGVGMLVGIIVNFTIVPPLSLRESAGEISALRSEIAQLLNSMADALVDQWPPENEDWLDGVRSLDSSIRAAEPTIEEASESRRVNPRARWHQYDVQEDFDDLEALSMLGRHTLDLGETLSAAIWAEPVPAALPEGLAEPLSDALARMGELVEAWNAKVGADEAAEAAEDALRTLDGRLRGLSPGEQSAELGSAIFTLRRMLAVLRNRTDPHQD